jgi:hypothetical protein
MNFKITKMQLATGLKDLILFELSGKANEDSSCWTESYQNGREQGCSIYYCNHAKERVETRNVSISENRNSDNIVVYFDNHAFQGMDEQSYKNAKYFKPGQYNEVIKYCVDYLVG